VGQANDMNYMDFLDSARQKMPFYKPDTSIKTPDHLNGSGFSSPTDSTKAAGANYNKSELGPLSCNRQWLQPPAFLKIILIR